MTHEELQEIIRFIESVKAELLAKKEKELWKKKKL